MVGSRAMDIVTGSGSENAVFTSLLHVSLSRAAVALNGEPGPLVIECLNLRDIILANDSFAARELPADEFHGKTAEQDDTRRLGVYPDVVFGSRSHVSFTTGSTTHDHAASDFGRDRGPLRQRESNVGERTQGDECESGVRFDRIDHRVNRVRLSGRLARRRILVIAESVATMKPRRALMESK